MEVNIIVRTNRWDFDNFDGDFRTHCARFYAQCVKAVRVQGRVVPSSPPLLPSLHHVTIHDKTLRPHGGPGPEFS